eukprot:7378476-Prymnesium_polylepis.1
MPKSSNVPVDLRVAGPTVVELTRSSELRAPTVAVRMRAAEVWLGRAWAAQVGGAWSYTYGQENLGDDQDGRTDGRTDGRNRPHACDIIRDELIAATARTDAVAPPPVGGDHGSAM